METSQLISKANQLTGFYTVLVFAGRYFQKYYNSFILGSSHREVSFYCNTGGGFILGGIADCQPVTFLDFTLAGVLMIFFAFLLQEHPSMIAPAVYIP